MQDRIDAALVRSILDYDPETGVFTWRARPREHFKTQRGCSIWNARFANRQAGFKDHEYLRISIKHVGKFYAHRLAWLYVTGELPEEQIDHIDMDRANNVFANLRKANNAENNQNRGCRSDNTSGVKGVHWNVRSRKWQVQIEAHGKRRHLGYFDEDRFDEAAAVYEKAARALHGEFARTA